MAVRLGICNWIMEAFLEPGCCAQLAALGIEGVQLDLGSVDEGFPLTRPDVQRAWLEDARAHGVRVTGLMVNEVMRNGMTEAEGSPARKVAEAALAAGVRAASAMGLRRVIVPSFRASGLVTAGDPLAEDAMRTADCLRRACDLAKPYGLRVATENALCPADLHRLWAAVGRDNLELYLDAFNYAYWGGQCFPDLLETLLPLNGDEVHLKDGTAEAPGSKPLGQGFCEMDRTLAALRRRGFDGWLFVENFYERPAFDHGGRDHLALLQDDMLYVRKRMNGEG